MTDVNILKTGSDLLHFLSKRWWVILLSLIIGLVIGYSENSNINLVYNTQLIGEANNISNVGVVGVLNTLKSSANTNNYLKLSAQTGIKKNVTKSIFALDANIFENDNPTENLNNNIFFIRISTNDLSKIPSFIVGLERFINSDKLFKGKGNIQISREFDLPAKPKNQLSTLLLKYGIVFFVLGVVISILISFYFNVKAYQKEANNA